MKKYLLDTNICVFFLRGKFGLNTKIQDVGEQNCFISEITVAELKFGIENAGNEEQKTRNRDKVQAFLSVANILPIFPVLDIYATEKVRLRKRGMLIDDFDLLIAATAIAHDLIMVTNNTNHLSRMQSIIIEDWIKN